MGPDLLGANMQNQPTLALIAISLSLALALVSAGGNDAAAAPPGAQALQGTTSGSIQQRTAKCPVTAGDFGDIQPAKAQEVCGTCGTGLASGMVHGIGGTTASQLLLPYLVLGYQMHRCQHVLWWSLSMGLEAGPAAVVCQQWGSSS